MAFTAMVLYALHRDEFIEFSMIVLYVAALFAVNMQGLFLLLNTLPPDEVMALLQLGLQR